MQSTETDLFEIFVSDLRKLANRKADLYDGKNKTIAYDRALGFAVEELGEISSAFIRDRMELARVECFDLAHSSFLIWLSLQSK